MIKTALKQFPSYINKYPPESQIFLSEFFNVLHHYETADFDRKNLSNRLLEIVRKWRNSKEYLHLPFLWFAVDYFEKSIAILDTSTFHGKEFYGFLVRSLKGKGKIKGYFQLISKITSIKDLEWEQIQYFIVKQQDLLTDRELHVLKTAYSFTSEKGYQSLNLQSLKRAIVNEVKSPGLARELPRFLRRINMRWDVMFYPLAFGVEQLCFQFQLGEFTTLKEIIDFRNPKNTLLCNSYVYRIRGFPKSFLGTITVPIPLVKHLKTYLQQCVNQELLFLNKLTKLTQRRIFTSLSQFQPGKGWDNLAPSKRDKITAELKTKSPHKRTTTSKASFLTPRFNENFTYKMMPEPEKVISLLCKFPRVLTYRELPFGNKQSLLGITQSEKVLLRDLYDHKTIQISCRAFSLVENFSYDIYWCVLPKMPLYQLSRLLSWLPFGQLFLSKTHMHLWTYLTSEIVKWLRNDLQWEIFPLLREHNSLPISPNWYDFSNLEWKAPQILL